LQTTKDSTRVNGKEANKIKRSLNEVALFLPCHFVCAEKCKKIRGIYGDNLIVRPFILLIIYVNSQVVFTTCKLE